MSTRESDALITKTKNLL